MMVTLLDHLTKKIGAHLIPYFVRDDHRASKPDEWIGNKPYHIVVSII